MFRVKYPIEALDGGLNNKYDPPFLHETESPDCLNVVFGDRGSVGTRQGSSKLNSVAVGSFACNGLFTTNFSQGGSTMVAWYNGTMYAWSGSTFTTIASAQSVFTAGTRVDAAQYQDYMFFGNGTKNYKYDGTNFTRHGVAQPNSTPTVATTSAGALAGDFLYKVSYVNSALVEGDVSTFTGTINAAASSVIGLTAIPVAPTSYGVAARKIYRGSAPADTFKLVTTLNDNTTTTYADNTADADLGANAPIDKGEPPAWDKIVAHKDRLFMLDPTQKGLGYYTDLGEPFTVQATNFVFLNDRDGEPNVGIGVHADGVVIGKRTGIMFIYMASTDPNDWEVVKTQSKYGFGGHFAKADYSNLMMYLGQRHGVLTGFYALAGVANNPDRTDLSVVSVKSDSKSDRIEPDVFNFNSGAIDVACAIEYKNKLYFAVPFGSGQTTNNRIYAFDFQTRDKSQLKGSWVPFTGLNPADFTVWGGDLYFGSAIANGFVYKLFDGTYNDDGAAIDSYWWSKEFGGHKQHRDRTKDWRWGIFTVETLGNWDMNLTYRTDSDAGSGNTQQINLNPGGSLWGGMVWGSDVWGGGVTRSDEKIFFPGSVGTRLQIKFDNQNTADQAFKVVRCALTYNLRSER